jgi:hypothetical protein
MQLLFQSSRTKYIGATAAALLLLAWSVDNLIQKKIDSISRVLDTASTAQLQVQFQTSVIHDLADLKAGIENFIIEQKQENAEPVARTVPTEFVDINSGQIHHMYQFTERMQDFRLAAELYQAIFYGVDLPAEIQEKISSGVEFYQRLNTELVLKQKEAQDFLRSVNLRKFGGKPLSGPEDMPEDPLPEPTPEDLEVFDRLVAEYFEILENNVHATESIDSSMHDGFSEAMSYVGARRDTLSAVSSFISIAYILIFMVGSGLSILASISKSKEQ